MAACGILMRLHSEDVMAELAVLKKWILLLQKIPVINRFTLRTAFFTTPRKYPENFIPLMAISGVLILRYVMAEVNLQLPPERIPML
jgi:hypothetical protein